MPIVYLYTSKTRPYEWLKTNRLRAQSTVEKSVHYMFGTFGTLKVHVSLIYYYHCL